MFPTSAFFVLPVVFGMFLNGKPKRPPPNSGKPRFVEVGDGPNPSAPNTVGLLNGPAPGVAILVRLLAALLLANRSLALRSSLSAPDLDGSTGNAGAGIGGILGLFEPPKPILHLETHLLISNKSGSTFGLCRLNTLLVTIFESNNLPHIMHSTSSTSSTSAFNGSVVVPFPHLGQCTK
jgi:hypothetical protein